MDNPAVAGWRSVAATPPLAGLAGATVAALNTYKKNFLKKFFKKVTNNANCAKMSTPSTHN